MDIRRCNISQVLSPYDAEDCKGLLKAAIRDPDPVVFLENEITYGQAFDIQEAVLDPGFVLPIGQAKVMRPGTDITIVGHSIGVGFAMDAAVELEKQGISCEVSGEQQKIFGTSAIKYLQVINLRSIRPLDMDTINESIKKTNHCMTVEGGWPQHGVGAEISACIAEGPAFHYLDAPVIRICEKKYLTDPQKIFLEAKNIFVLSGGVDAPMPYAATLEAAATPQPHNIVGAVKRMLGKQ